MKNMTNDGLGYPLRITVNSPPPQSAKHPFGHRNVLKAIGGALKGMVSNMTIRFNPAIGRKISNGWNGVIGEVANNKCDVGVGTFSATLERFQLTKLSTTLGYGSPISIFSGRIHENSNKNDFHVFNTFSFDLWIAIVLTLITLSFVDKIISYQVKRRAILVILLCYIKLLLAQDSRYFIRRSNFKILLSVGIGIISLNLLIIEFNSNILSNLLYDPIEIGRAHV